MKLIAGDPLDVCSTRRGFHFFRDAECVRHGSGSQQSWPRRTRSSSSVGDPGNKLQTDSQGKLLHAITRWDRVQPPTELRENKQGPRPKNLQCPPWSAGTGSLSGETPLPSGGRLRSPLKAHTPNHFSRRPPVSEMPNTGHKTQRLRQAQGSRAAPFPGC